MNNHSKLIRIKIVHTLVWIFFNLVIFYMLYAAINNKLDKWLWMGYIIILLELITLTVFKFSCPITIIARRYSFSKKANFDIYLPIWLAKFNRIIYATILLAVIFITVFQLCR